MEVFSLSERNGFHPADIVHQIAASALAGWIERRKSFFYVCAYSRRYTTRYRLEVQSRRRAGYSGRVARPADTFSAERGSGFRDRCRRHVDLELDALTDRKRPHNTLEDLLSFLPGIWPRTLVKITGCFTNRKNRRIKGLTTLGYR